MSVLSVLGAVLLVLLKGIGVLLLVVLTLAVLYHSTVSPESTAAG